MKKSSILIAALAFALSLAGAADAKSCKDAKGKFTKCPPAAAAAPAAKTAPVANSTPVTAPAPTAKAAPCRDAKGKFTKCPAPVAVAHHPDCKKGKPCGDSCIAKEKVCHK